MKARFVAPVVLLATMALFGCGGDYNGPKLDGTTTAPVGPTITTTTLPDGTETAAYNQTLAATGGAAPYTWSLFFSPLPSNLTLSTAGVLSGTLAGGTAGSYILDVIVIGSDGGVGFRSLTLTVNAAPAITMVSLPSGTVGSSYGPVVLTATGGTLPYNSWSAVGLPAGLIFDTLTSAISGTPTGPAGTSNVGFTVTDANLVTSPTVTLALTVN